MKHENGRRALLPQPQRAVADMPDEPAASAPADAADGRGWFDSPSIDALFCGHDVRLPAGGTLVTLHTSGWGALRVDAIVGGAAFRYRSVALSPARRTLDLVVPVDSTVQVRFVNVFGRAQQALLATSTAPTAPAVPRLAGVVGIRMPTLLGPAVDARGLRRLAAPSAATFVTALRPMPPLLLHRERLRAGLRSEALRSVRAACGDLPARIGQRQRYRRELMLARCLGVAAKDVDMRPVQRELRDWMAFIHHGPDDEGDGNRKPDGTRGVALNETMINADHEART